MPKTIHYSPFTTHRPGARLYHSTASVWLSVDPLSDKYPSVSPYVYCANNPVRLVDLDGREIEFAGENERQLYNDYKATIQYHIDNDKNNSQYVNIMNELNAMEASDQVFTIRIGENIQHKLDANVLGSHTFDIKTNKIDINISENTGNFSQIQAIAHELKHGYQYLRGEIDFSQDGLKGGYLYDCSDERAAFQRTNLFSIDEKSYADVNSGVRDYKLRGIPTESRCYLNLDETQKMSYDNLKKVGYYH